MSETMRVAMHVTLREFSTQPEVMLEVPLGGPDCVFVMGVETDPTTDKIHIRLDATGYDDIAMLTTTLRAVIDHLETVPYNILSEDGVVEMEPIRKKAED